MERVLVTGANGFIGSHLCRLLVERGYCVRAVMRNAEAGQGIGASEVARVGDIGPTTDWTQAVHGVDVVIHLAGRAHVTRERSQDPLAEFRKINVEGTERLAIEASGSGVKRLIYLSSIGVNGPFTGEKPFVELDRPSPCNPYTRSKYEAEKALKAVSATTGLPVVVVRSPLVYGPHVPGNFLSLLYCVRRGIPLPFGGVRNKRSLIYVENLSDFLVRCMERTQKAKDLYVISDGEDVSTPELVRMLATAMGRQARLISLDTRILELMLRSIGKGAVFDKLCRSLQVSAERARADMAWAAPVSLADGLRETVKSYMVSA